MELKDNIRIYRKENNLTLEELGKRIHVSKQTIARYENGEISNIPYDKIVAMADVFGISPSILMGWQEETNFEIKEPNSQNSKNEFEEKLLFYFPQLTKDQQELIINMMKQMLPNE